VAPPRPSLGRSAPDCRHRRECGPTLRLFLVDSGLAAAALRVGADDVMRDGDLLGRILETFVAAQLRVDASVSARRPILHHVRDQAGRHEIDLLADAGARGVLAFEVKADAAPRAGSARHLTWLRERLGDGFLAGVVLHTGPRAYELDDGIVALPIAALWG
jgi:predicted AAA+ superfamily ATPase